MPNKTEPQKRWVLHTPTDENAARDIAALQKELSVSRTLATLLVGRGFRTPQDAKTFLRMEGEILQNPFLMQDIEKAVNRIRRAIRLHEKITVFGDYDVDGVTAVCTAYLYFRHMGADIDCYIPSRFGEGYGMTKKALDGLAAAGTKLIVTVDTGVTAIDEIAYATSLGMDTVVTDHHACKDELPPAVAVVNPHRPDCRYPFKELAGVGVVFKLICAYEESTSGDRRAVCVRRICDAYSDLVAIGTIADVMPILGENRLIVCHGLQNAERGNRPGLVALMEAAAAGKEKRQDSRRTAQMTTGYVSFTLAPRINAAGRVLNAMKAVDLFLAPDMNKAAPLANELCEANRERQNEENNIVEEAYRMIEEDKSYADDSVLVLQSDHWHHGIIGIVASRITERYGLPSILVSYEGNESSVPLDNDVGKASGRSVEGMNLVNALSYCQDLLVKYGGHALAAGFSVTRGNFDAFRRRINEYAKTCLKEEDRVLSLDADCEVSLDDVSMDLAEELQKLEPYGVGNPSPTFVVKNALIEEIVPVSGGKHVRFTLGNGNRSFGAMYFSHSPSQLNLYVHDRADVLFNLDINVFNGRRSVQLVVKDIRPPEEARALRQAEEKRLQEIIAGAPFGEEENVLPTREDFAAIYTLVSRSCRQGVDTLSVRDILARLGGMETPPISYVKLKLIIRILVELNLMGTEEIGEDLYRFSITFTNKKTDLEKSTWLRRLRSQQR